MQTQMSKRVKDIRVAVEVYKDTDVFDVIMFFVGIPYNWSFYHPAPIEGDSYKNVTTPKF